MSFLLVCFLAVFTPAALGQSSQDCLACHSNPGLTMTKGGKTVPLTVNEAQLKESVHAAMNCVDCHAGFEPDQIPHAKVIKPVQCRNCHEAAGFDKSIHGMGGDTPIAGCTACHGSHDVRRVKDPKSAVSRTKVSATCGTCHGEELRQFAASAHGGVLTAPQNQSPTCVGCHGAHNVVSASDPASLVYRTKEAALCLKCHLENPEIEKQVGYSTDFMAGYAKSVHGTALASGNLKSATCSNCHGAHDLKKASDPASSVNTRNIPKTCASCHGEIAKVYNESIHGTARIKGNEDSPTCTSCHGEHEILGPKDPRSLVAPANVSVQVCAKCHNSVQLSRKYGMPSQQFNSFQDSYHGLAARAGSVEVANCASCHGIHNIKPSSDPTSTINKANLAATCGRCHPGAGKNFARGAVHVVIGRETGPAILFWIRAIYIFLIVAVVGGMVLHNLLDFIQRTRRRFAIRRGEIEPEHTGAGQYVRMTLNDRIQHALMFSSFIILAITGFMLKYPDAWWVVPIRQISGKFFVVRSILHRIAGAVMIAISLYHLFYVIVTKHGRRFVRDISPAPKDIADVWTNVRYIAGVSKRKPLFDRFGYIEKAEYWALVWGVIIMGATGIVMWFDNYFISLFTKLGWDVSRTIHFYEAVLATLAILVWHFYYVILNPDVYPMSTAWITGKISEHEMADEHPLELERIKNETPTQE
jgi:cytochrome b subunit of formate dehydrogenase/nitrate/TMAO reductase-like tetraheme cytochrome c subunit